MKKAILIFLVSLVGALILAVPVSAAIWGSAADWSGSRSTSYSNQIIGTDGWDSGGFSLSWNITKDENNIFDYTYTLNWTRKDPSHLIIQLSDDFQSENMHSSTFGGDVNRAEGPDTFAPNNQGSSNPGLPDSIYGYKFEFGEGLTSPAEVKFTTDRAPVWHVFYAKDGTDNQADVYAYSAAFLSDDYMLDDSLTSASFIAAPNSAVPIPAAVWLFGTGLLGLVAVKRKSFKSQE